MSSYTWNEYPRALFTDSLVKIKQHDMSQNDVITASVGTILTTILEHDMSQNDVITASVGTILTTISECTIHQIGPYALKRPLRVRVKPIEGMYVAIEDEFDLWSDGETEQQAIEGVKAFFLHVLREYLETPDDNLDLLARQEKKQYIAITT